MYNFTPPERALILHIGNTLAQGDDKYVVKNTGLDGEVRALRQLNKEKIMEIAGVQDNKAVKQLMNNLLSHIFTTAAPPVVTNGSSVYLGVQLTDAGRRAYELIRRAV